MNQRYISLAVAAILGLATATELAEPNFLVDVTDAQKASCIVIDHYTIYDFMPLHKDEGYTNQGYKVNFCVPFTLQDNTHAFVYKQSSGDIFADGSLTRKNKVTLENDDGVRHLRYQMDTQTKCSYNES